MATSIRRAGECDMFAVYRLLAGSTLNSRVLPLAARQRLFHRRWGGEEDYFGYLMEDGGSVVGFLGTLFTRRPVNGRLHDFCEIHSWYVEEPYRNQSLNLLIPVLGIRRKTIVNHTPTQTVYDICRKFGFQDLESEVRLHYPVPGSPRRLRIVTDALSLPDLLAGEDLRIFYDHRDIACIHAAISELGDAEPPLYLILKTMRRRWFERFGRLLYASDRERFVRLVGALGWRLCIRHGWQGIVTESRDLPGTRPVWFSRRVIREVPSQFKSASLTAADLVPIYTQPLLQGYRLH